MIDDSMEDIINGMPVVAPLTFTAQQLCNKVAELCKQYPRAVYCIANLSECKYTSGEVTSGPANSRGCIIGQALCALQPALHSCLRYFDTEGAVDVENLVEILCVDVSPAQLTFLNAVQVEQDGGNTWGSAYASAGDCNE